VCLFGVWFFGLGRGFEEVFPGVGGFGLEACTRHVGAFLGCLVFVAPWVSKDQVTMRKLKHFAS
jgi:hypothetical protein